MIAECICETYAQPRLPLEEKPQAMPQELELSYDKDQGGDFAKTNQREKPNG